MTHAEQSKRRDKKEIINRPRDRENVSRRIKRHVRKTEALFFTRTKILLIRGISKTKQSARDRKNESKREQKMVRVRLEKEESRILVA